MLLTTSFSLYSKLGELPDLGLRRDIGNGALVLNGAFLDLCGVDGPATVGANGAPQGFPLGRHKPKCARAQENARAPGRMRARRKSDAIVDYDS